MKLDNPTRLTRLMTKHGWSEADVANILGMAPNKQKYREGHHRAVADWLSGVREPSMGWHNVFKLLESEIKNHGKKK